MYKHHEESLQNLIDYFKQKQEVIALVLGGSVAKGCEREDSDLDVMVIIDDLEYEKKVASNTVAETIKGHCTYEGGYFDIKYMTKNYLLKATQCGSEPTRNSFLKSRVLFSNDEEIDSIVARIPIFQEAEYDKKMLSFYSDFWLNYNYFWKSCPIDGYMKLRVASEIIYCIYRMILQQNRILFPCNRNMELFVENSSDKPYNIVRLAREFIKNMDNESCEDFVNSFLAWTTYDVPEDASVLLGTYVKDFEQWWQESRPLISEW